MIIEGTRDHRGALEEGGEKLFYILTGEAEATCWVHGRNFAGLFSFQSPETSLKSIAKSGSADVPLLARAPALLG
ncbi:hypothetical protein AGOR_G00225220 [Albula goreensis]|uniref:Uncharacterized protein n=1 Tax=Albula goreensis TaxID=1534307 RepID=A0A8T3CK34_9TELE|nr:hypothetical protein AGOR_G00225220 [Albula goreensis]